ncbi:hypothetical protein OIC43_41790 [Streptomyces sp. NBC_00825]|uniref:hypothetical protein n=1 Tax=unclassified Streptomyces TaxID=2593676 RepID=UPI002ED646BD|nr:hypothetical protein OG832_01895 [Streptomyces sp. NBC_00826]WTH95927.1 hypothetical protein OIC43_41790 [Streptomyces sp. NBC_00825]WTI04647.1 hypothetical protein OHA23_41765 [Streptomyces sp. NBC_00822]
MAGPALLWAFMGLGYGLSRTGWAAGLALTAILIALAYASLDAESTGHGFSHWWLFRSLLVVCSLGEFCIVPYVHVSATIGRRRRRRRRRH